MTRIIAILLAFLATINAVAGDRAVSGNAAFNDGIDRTDPNFVTASLLVASPIGTLYSCVGHAVYRLECPAYKLDYCFTYESESVTDKVVSYFAGRLKMGMFAIPTAEYLKLLANDGRGVVQYRMNLPPDAKQRLWKYLDERVAEGAYLPYDYLKRGCAQALFSTLNRALEPTYKVQIDKWPERFTTWTRREFVDASVQAFPWTKFFLYTIVGTESDWAVSKPAKVVIPSDLLELLRTAKVNGATIIDSEGVELLPAKPMKKASLITPLVVSWMAVVLATVNWFLKMRWLDWLFLAFQSLAGFFFTYLVCVSDLTATDWNWLIVPFNLLPLMFWHWRQKWALLFAGVLVLWESGMIFYPHRLTDPAYLVLVAAYIVMYARIGWHGRDALPRVQNERSRKSATLPHQSTESFRPLCSLRSLWLS